MRTLALLTLLALGTPNLASAQVMLVGIDTKVVFNDQGQRVNLAPGRDLLQAYDLAEPAQPRLVGEIELPNSIIGPPTNLAVTPDGTLGLMANALKWTPGAGGT